MGQDRAKLKKGGRIWVTKFKFVGSTELTTYF
jgi:hypothetical protein